MKPALQNWFKTENNNCKGVVLLMHGLNNRAELMQPIAKKLTENGFDVFVPSLKGHLNDFAEFKDARAIDWLSNVSSAYTEVSNYAEESNLPLHYTGFSLGGLIGVNLLAQNKMPKISKVWLLAPALETSWIASLLHPLLLLNISINIPSRAPGLYRAHAKLPIEGYKALLEIKNQVHQLTIKDIATLIHIDAKDELVSYGKLKKFLAKRNFKNWQISLLDSSESKGIHHMIADPFYAGKNNWENMLKEAIAFFSS